MSAPAAALLLVLLAGGRAPGPSPGVLTRELSDALGKKLEMLEKFDRDPKAKRSPVDVSESELNSYVRFALAEKVPRGLREVRIVIRQGRLELRGLANLSELSELKQKAASAASFLSLLGGEMAVEVVADFKSDRGFGQFELLTAQIGRCLSASVVSDIVARATDPRPTRPNGFASASFRLPIPPSGLPPAAGPRHHRILSPRSAVRPMNSDSREAKKPAVGLELKPETPVQFVKAIGPSARGRCRKRASPRFGNCFWCCRAATRTARTSHRSRVSGRESVPRCAAGSRR